MAFDSKLFWYRTSEANRVILNAARRLSRNAKKNITSMGVDDSGEMRRHVGQRTKKRDGLIEKVSLKTYRYGIIRESGAGRGWPKGEKSSGIQNPSGKERKEAPWISQAFQSVVPKLANDLAKIKGDDFVDLIDDQFKGSLKDRYRI